MALLLGAALLSACVELIPPVSPRGVAFNEAEYQPYLGEGAGTIAGEACLWTRNGELMRVPERGVYLWPATAYVTEHLEREVLEGDVLWFAPDARLYKYRRETRSDKAGRFEFEKLPPGEYYLTCLFDWHDTLVPPREDVISELRSRWVFTKVSLAPGEHVRVGVSGPLQPEAASSTIREIPPPPPSSAPQALTLLDRVLFDSGKADLKPSGKKELDGVLARLEAMGPGVIRVEGHTDNRPIKGALQKRFADNYELSTARAAAVVQYLTGKGVDPARISAEGFGERRPVASNETEEGRQRNRRIEIVLVPKEAAETQPARPEFVAPPEQPPQPSAPPSPVPPSQPEESRTQAPIPSPAGPETADRPEPGMPPQE